MAAITLTNLSKSFGSVEVLKDINLDDLRPGILRSGRTVGVR